MRYLSLFSGVEAASVAWAPLGWEPLAFCEVDEFPAAVLAHRFPHVPNLGDVCKVDWKEFHGRYGAVDVLVGGSPCQSFSIAGNREGLSGESRLMFEYIRAVRDLVHASSGQSPRYVLWENVPGALSSEGGDAFGQLLAELDELGYGLAWRVLDAQYVRVPGGPRRGFFGPVAQRRRRVFLVGVLGSPHAAEILFERTCLRGDHPKGREARQALAEDVGDGVADGRCAGFKYHAGRSAGGIGYETGTSPTLTADYHQPAVLTPWDVQSMRVTASHGISPTLQAGSGEGMTVQPIVMTTANTNANGSNVSDDGVIYTLDGSNSNAVGYSIPENAINRPTGGTNGPMAYGLDEGAPTLRASRNVPAVAFTQNQRDEARLEGGDGSLVGAIHTGSGKNDHVIMTQYGEVAGTLTARADSSPCADRGQNVICMADDTAKAAVDEDMCGTLKVGGGVAADSVQLSNGCEVVGALCARDFKGIGNQDVRDGKVICQKRSTCRSCATPAPTTPGGCGSMIGEDVSYTLSTQQDQTMFQPDGDEYVVRKLTPTESNRLQGFPDGWDDLAGCDPCAVTSSVRAALGYEPGGKEHRKLARRVLAWSRETPDTPRYKAMGNSMAVPVIMWIGRRIGAFDVLHADEVGLERI